MLDSSHITENLKVIHAEIDTLSQEFSRNIKLIAVTKGCSIDFIKTAITSNQLIFGENYLQEALPKIRFLADFGKKLEWHFLGKVQANKARDLARNFDYVHSVCGLKVAALLNKYRQDASANKLSVCMQINIDNDSNKLGLSVSDLSKIKEIAFDISSLNMLNLKGLMCITKQYSNDIETYDSFLRMHEIFVDINQALTRAGFVKMEILSMGMSSDYLIAIKAGSNCVRIGRKIFQKDFS